MTSAEAEIVTKIMLTADGWCPACQGNLIDLFRQAFPEHAELAASILQRADEFKAERDAADAA